MEHEQVEIARRLLQRDALMRACAISPSWWTESALRFRGFSITELSPTPASGDRLAESANTSKGTQR